MKGVISFLQKWCTMEREVNWIWGTCVAPLLRMVTQVDGSGTREQNNETAEPQLSRGASCTCHTQNVRASRQRCFAETRESSM